MRIELSLHPAAWGCSEFTSTQAMHDRITDCAASLREVGIWNGPVKFTTSADVRVKCCGLPPEVGSEITEWIDRWLVGGLRGLYEEEEVR
jgi:hypothetical protein